MTWRRKATSSAKHHQGVSNTTINASQRRMGDEALAGADMSALSQWHQQRNTG
jgi:hypothetical protein